MYGQKFGQKLLKPLGNRENPGMGKKEKPKLDSARGMRGIHFIDPDDQEHKEILKNARMLMQYPLNKARLRPR